MKKIISLFAVAALAVIMYGCGGNASDPRSVADAFMKVYLIDVDGKAMAKYCDEDLAEDILEEFLGEEDESPMLAAFRTAIVDKLKEFKLKYTVNEERSEWGDDECRVYYDVTSSKHKEFEGTSNVRLKKDDAGKWVITRYDSDLNDMF